MLTRIRLYSEEGIIVLSLWSIQIPDILLFCYYYVLLEFSQHLVVTAWWKIEGPNAEIGDFI